jgi:hypothetical protein
VRLLGMVDVPSVLALQKLMVHEVRLQSRTNAAVLICEHPPTLTVGEGATLLELPASPRELESRLIAVHKLHRDGHAILHQPGQLAAYIVVSLPECSMSVDEYRGCLQRAVVKTCEEVQVVASIQPSDPTAVFARRDFLARRVTDFHTKFDSPYNTYKYTGLPPGPITMSSISSLDAVLNYEKHNYLYFCAVGDESGLHSFATNLSEHNRNARIYRDNLIRRGLR